MAFYQFLCSVAVMVVLSANGCYSSSGECGKMMKGHHSKVLPWQVDIGDGMCSGALISDQWVLTVGCAERPVSKMKVTLGGNANETQANQTQANQMQANETNNWQTLYVKDVRCRNNTSDGMKMKSDMCLLKLSNWVHFTDTINPICLASKDSYLHSKLETYVWSGGPHSSAMKVPLVGKRECRCLYPQRSMSKICSGRKSTDKMDESEMEEGDMYKSEMEEGDVYKSEMEEGDVYKSEMYKYEMEEGDMYKYEMEGDMMMDDCKSGMGAMMAGVQDDAWILVGVSTAEEMCEASDMPMFFTPVSMLQQWIMEVTGRSHNSFKTLWFQTPDPDDHYQCPHKCSSYDLFCWDDSVFTNAATMPPSSAFVLLCVLALSLCFVKW